MAKKRRRTRKTDRVGPTPETKAKLSPDPIHALVYVGYETTEGRRYLDSDAEHAAEEIRKVYLAVVRSMLAGIGRYGEYTPGHYEIDSYLAAAYSQRYKPWAQAQGRRLELVIDAVVERNAPPSEPAKEAVCRALEGYARMMRIPVDIPDAMG